MQYELNDIVIHRDKSIGMIYKITESYVCVSWVFDAMNHGQTSSHENKSSDGIKKYSALNPNILKLII